MKLINPFLFIIVFLLFACWASPVQANSFRMVSDSIQTDSIPRIKYIGYRLYLTHFEQVKEKKGYLYIKLSAINTGNKKMQLGKGAAQIFPVVKIDPSIETSGLSDYQTEIYYKLLEEKLTVPIGAISTNIELKLLLDASDSQLDGPAKVIPESGEIEPELVEAAKPKKTKKVKDKKPKSKKAEKIVEQSTDPIPTEEVLAEPTPELEETPIADEKVAEKEEEEGCADLVIQEVKVLKRTKGSITLQYQLYNKGTGKAPLVVGQKKEQQSIALRAHLSSSEKLTRGAIVISSTFLYGEELTLASGESYTGKLKLALHKLTKFTPVLILELDAFEFIKECDEHNNLERLRLLEEEIR